MSVEKRDVMFKSGETFAAGWFFVPQPARSGERLPAVAMAHGFGAVKEMYLETSAQGRQASRQRPKRRRMSEGHEWRRRGMVQYAPAATRSAWPPADTGRAPFDGPDVVFAEHRALLIRAGDMRELLRAIA